MKEAVRYICRGLYMMLAFLVLLLYSFYRTKLASVDSIAMFYLIKIGVLFLGITCILCIHRVIKDLWPERLEELKEHIKFELKLK